MATSKAVIRKSKVNSKGECTVFIRYVHKEKYADFSTGIKVKLAAWSQNKELVNSAKLVNKNKQTESIRKALVKSDNETNTQIALKREEILAIVRECQLEGAQPMPSLIKEKYQSKTSSTKKTENKEEEYIYDLFSHFISNSTLSEGTLKGYRTCLMHLSRYEEHTSKRLRVRDMNISLIKQIEIYLSKTFKRQGGGTGLQDSTVGASKKNLKVFLKNLMKKGYPIDLDLEDIKVSKSSTPIHFLTEEEVQQFYKFELSTHRLKRVRDLFIFNCYTGLRFSDLSRLTKNHIQDDSIVLRTFKNQTDAYIPLTSIPRKILEEYNYQLPSISDQKFNEYIKDAGEEASLDNQVEIISTQSGNKKYSYAPKWKILSSHIAIKTFITMCGSKGISPKVVSEITGKSVNIIMKHYYGTNRDTIKAEMGRAFG